MVPDSSGWFQESREPSGDPHPEPKVPGPGGVWGGPRGEPFVQDPCPNTPTKVPGSAGDSVGLPVIKKVLSGWYSVLGRTRATTAEATEFARHNATLHAALRLLDPGSDDDGRRLDPRVIGNRLSRLTGMPVDGFQLVQAGTKGRAVRWRVERV